MNIVREHINFERGLEPKDAMHIGNRIHKGDVFQIKKYHPGTGKWFDYFVQAKSDEEKDAVISGQLCKRFVTVETPSGNDWVATYNEEKGVWIYGK